MDHLINFVTNGPGIIIIHEFFCVLEQFQFPSNLIHSGFQTTQRLLGNETDINKRMHLCLTFIFFVTHSKLHFC